MPCVMTKPGARNLITDIAGLSVGNAEDERVRTGVTVIVPDRRIVAAVDVRGGGPGTRETDLLDPVNHVDDIDAIVLSGGSVYGLEAASGVAAWLGARGRGYSLRGLPMVAPIVPGAILFDLANGGDKSWGEEPPYRALGRLAIEAARADFALGNSGAGRGARAGGLKGGLGSASAITEDGYTVGALAAVNAFGSVLVPGTRTFWAWALEQDNELGGQTAPILPKVGLDLDFPADTKAGRVIGARTNTTLGVVAVDAMLTSAEAKRIAIMAQDGLARAIRPVHTPYDGDVVFALATGARSLAAPQPLTLARLGTIAADCLARAVARGVYEARSVDGATAYRDLAVKAGI